MVDLKTIKAALAMDWLQVVYHGEQPCFFLEETGRFCGRAQRWEGHERFHPYVSLAHLVLDSEQSGRDWEYRHHHDSEHECCIECQLERIATQDEARLKEAQWIDENIVYSGGYEIDQQEWKEHLAHLAIVQNLNKVNNFER